jgi:hypothetical protein
MDRESRKLPMGPTDYLFDTATGGRHTSPSFTFAVYPQVATRRYIDEQAVWTLMRFADEPAERAPNRRRTRAESDEPGHSAGLEAGEFDRAIERLNDADE